MTIEGNPIMILQSNRKYETVSLTPLPAFSQNIYPHPKPPPPPHSALNHSILLYICCYSTCTLTATT